MAEHILIIEDDVSLAGGLCRALASPEVLTESCGTLEEAVVNIVDNAIKYTHEGSVTLRICPFELFCCIQVSDTGIGIPEEEHTKIFARFYRGAAANAEGVGIGLYLAREILTKEGGYIRVSSCSGGGSVFSVYLPR